MTDNIPVRSITGGEAVKLRSNGQHVELGMYIQTPSNIYTMRINQAFTSVDSIVELIYDGGSGTYTNAKAGMTVLISGVGYGEHDKGICRLRKDLPSATTGTMSINETSDIQFEDNDYVTVIKAFSIWQRDLVLTADTVLMDNDIEFDATTQGGVLPRLGPICAVLFRDLITGEVSITLPSAALSVAYDGATLSSYLFACSTASGTAGLTTATPTFTFDSAGEHLISCAITDSRGRVTRAYRWVIVDPASREFELSRCESSFSAGGMTTRVKCYSNLTDIYDRAMVVLYTVEEVYGGVSGAIGKLTGYENILAVGWIDGKSITMNSDEGYAEFEIRDASYWLSKIRSFPMGVEDTTGAPDVWTSIQDLTVDKALFHLLFWTSTAWMVMDLFFTGDVLGASELSSPAGNLWDQITNISYSTIQATPLVNSLGQLFIERDTQFLSTADRATITVVQQITKEDYVDNIELEINTTTETARIELSGIAGWDGSSAVPVFSRAPGTIGSTYGDVISEENYLFADQDDCNRLAGCFLAINNQRYGPLDLDMASQTKFFDIAPRQLAVITIEAADNPFGVTLIDQQIIPRSVGYKYENGFLACSITFELVVDAVDGITYVPLEPVVDNIEANIKGLGTLGFPDFPSLDISFPPYLSSPILQPCSNYTHNSRSLPWSLSRLNGSDSTKLVAEIYLPCMLREDAFASYIRMNGYWYNDARNEYAVYGILGGTNVITASITQFVRNNVATFLPGASPIQVDGFRIVLNAGEGTPPFTDFGPGELLEAGGSYSSSTVCVSGTTYVVRGIGSWTRSGGGPQYNFARHPDNTSYNNGVGYSPTATPTMQLDIPTGCFKSEEVGDGLHGQTYFVSGIAGMGQFSFKPADLFATGINASGFSWELFSVVVNGRRIDLHSAAIHDICAVP